MYLREDDSGDDAGAAESPCDRIGGQAVVDAAVYAQINSTQDTTSEAVTRDRGDPRHELEGQRDRDFEVTVALRTVTSQPHSSSVRVRTMLAAAPSTNWEAINL